MLEIAFCLLDVFLQLRLVYIYIYNIITTVPKCFTKWDRNQSLLLLFQSMMVQETASVDS